MQAYTNKSTRLTGAGASGESLIRRRDSDVYPKLAKYDPKARFVYCVVYKYRF